MSRESSVKEGLERLSRTEGAAWGGFLKVHAAIVRELDAELQAVHGLPVSSYEVLLFLARAPERRMRMSELADSVLLSLSGMTRLVDRLVREGLVKRERSAEDRRGNNAVITDAGMARLCEAHATHLAGVRRCFLAHFSDAELQTLAVFWRRLLSQPSGTEESASECQG